MISMFSLLQLLQANPCHPLLSGDFTRSKQDEVRSTLPELGISEFLLPLFGV